VSDERAAGKCETCARIRDLLNAMIAWSEARPIGQLAEQTGLNPVNVSVRIRDRAPND
jgi:hypothetical protein